MVAGQQDEGFALIEVLVAFIVLSLVLGAATTSITLSARLYRRAEEIRQSQKLAENLFAREAAMPVDRPPAETGRDASGFSWTLSRQAIATDYLPGGKNLSRVSVDIFNSRRKHVGHYQTYVSGDP